MHCKFVLNKTMDYKDAQALQNKKSYYTFLELLLDLNQYRLILLQGCNDLPIY